MAARATEGDEHVGVHRLLGYGCGLLLRCWSGLWFRSGGLGVCDWLESRFRSRFGSRFLILRRIGFLSIGSNFFWLGFERFRGCGLNCGWSLDRSGLGFDRFGDILYRRELCYRLGNWLRNWFRNRFWGRFGYVFDCGRLDGSGLWRGLVNDGLCRFLNRR